MKSHSKIVGNVTDYQQQEFWSNREEPHLGQVLSHRLTGRNHSTLGGSFESSTNTKESFHTWDKFWVISWQEGIIPHLGEVLTHQLTRRSHGTLRGSSYSSANWKEPWHTWSELSAKHQRSAVEALSHAPGLKYTSAFSPHRLFVSGFPFHYKHSPTLGFYLWHAILKTRHSCINVS